MTVPLEVHILPPARWRPLIADARGDGRLGGFVAAVHGRHAGITPDAAAGWLAGAEGPWQGFRDQIMASLTDAGDAPRTQRDRRARFWSHLPPSLIAARAAAPLARAACERMGEMILFGHAAAPRRSPVPPDYDEYATRFRSTLAEALRDRALLGDMFWNRLAFTLWGSFRAPGTAPEPDAGVLHWLKTLQPDFAERLVRRRARRLQDAPNPNAVRPRQGGVSGIRVSRALDDMPDRLLSEYTLPRLIQLDRLLSTGFLARHRPPPMDQQRDLLVVGLMPIPDASASHAFVRAAWIDAMQRLAILLRHAGLPKSDFAFAAATTPIAATRTIVQLERFPDMARLDPWRIGLRERLELLRMQDWLPGALDRCQQTPVVPHAEAEEALALPPATAAWLGGVLDGWPAPGRGAAAYSRVHVHVLLPGRDAERLLDTPAETNAALVRTLGLTRSRSVGLSLLAVPGMLSDPLRLCRRDGILPIDGVDGDAGRHPDQLAGTLVDALIQDALETIHA